jgi:CO/xanthine dehydrogenase Mo-binding subunit
LSSIRWRACGGRAERAARRQCVCRWRTEDAQGTAQDFAAATDGALPTGAPGVEWAYGDLEAGFKQSDLVLDETFHTQSTSHQPLETRSAMAYWQSGKLFCTAPRRA